MSVKELLENIDDEVSIIHSSDFDIDITSTKFVPNDDDSTLTFENFDEKYKKVKTIETCVLHIDIRKSTQLNISHKPQTMTKLYSSFIRSMIKAAELHNGKVRNIVGDSIMVVFDEENCCTNAIDTAIMMNTICHNLINNYFKHNNIKCGIGIDYGKMMVVKCGTIKQGKDNSDYKSLVWVGNPANIASRLTSAANQVNKYVGTKNLDIYVNEQWEKISLKEFFDKLQVKYVNLLKTSLFYDDPRIKNFHYYEDAEPMNDATPPILITEHVFNQLCRENPRHISLSNRYWKNQKREIPDYKGVVFGCNTIV